MNEVGGLFIVRFADKVLDESNTTIFKILLLAAG